MGCSSTAEIQFGSSAWGSRLATPSMQIYAAPVMAETASRFSLYAALLRATGGDDFRIRLQNEAGPCHSAPRERTT